VQFGTAGGGGRPLRWPMASERDRLEEQQSRLDAMMDEFLAARQRRMEKQAIAHTNRSLTRPPVARPPGIPPAKLN
jgi:hypothetical protein